MSIICLYISSFCHSIFIFKLSNIFTAHSPFLFLLLLRSALCIQSSYLRSCSFRLRTLPVHMYGMHHHHHQGNRYLNSKIRTKLQEKTINVLLCIFHAKTATVRAVGRATNRCKTHLPFVNDVFIQFDVSIHRAFVWQRNKQNNCQRSIAETYID